MKQIIVSALTLMMFWVMAMITIEAQTTVTVGTYDLQFTNNTPCSGTQWCTTVQIKSSTASQQFGVGSHTVFIHYNAGSIKNPVYTSTNFNETNMCTSGSVAAYLTPAFMFNEAIIPSGNMTTIMSQINEGCPIVTDQWIDIGVFCFDVEDATQTTQLTFNTTQTQFNKNDNTNAPYHTQGAFNGLDVLPVCTSTPTGIEVNITAYLQGAYTSGGMMSNGLNTAPALVLPTTQPYNVAPWNYAGTESVTTVPTNMVDWVLVQASTGAGGTANVVETKAALLLTNGSIVDVTDPTMGVVFSTLTVGTSYEFIVRHRNHFPIATTMPVNPASGIINLTNASNSIYGGAFPQTIDMGNGEYAMIAGDANGDGFINATDFTVWQGQNATFFALPGYYNNTGNFNLDAFINATDYTVWQGNNAKFAPPALFP